MTKKTPFHIVVFFATLFIIGCNNQTNATKSVELISDNSSCRSDNLSWLRDIGITVDTLITDTIPNAFHKKGVYLDSLQIQKLISNKIPSRAPYEFSSIRLFAIKEISDSLTFCVYMYKFSDIEDIYGLIYNNKGLVTDVIKLPIPETSDIEDVIDDIEYIYYFDSKIEFTDNYNFIVTEHSSNKGFNNGNDECVFTTSLTVKTFYSISLNGKIKKLDVVKTQSCSG